MKNKIRVYERKDCERGVDGSLRLIDGKPLSRRDSHRLGFLHKSPHKRPGY